MDSTIGQCILTNPNGEFKNFTFDGVYFIDSTAEQIYNDIVYPLVEVRKKFLQKIPKKNYCYF